MKLTIRIARPSDIEPILNLLADYHTDAHAGFPAMKREIARKVVTAHIGSTLVAALDGRIVGVTALKRDGWWWTDEEFMADVYTYAQKEYRKYGVGMRLIRAAKAYASACGLPLIMAVISGTDVERKDKLYGRLGLMRVGGVYLRATR